MFIRTAKQAKEFMGDTVYWEEFDKTGRGYIFPRSGTLIDVHRGLILIDGLNHHKISMFRNLRTTMVMME
ncbi:MAG: hypothetical protein ACRDBQ_22215 [Shewanella sp.]